MRCEKETKNVKNYIYHTCSTIKLVSKVQHICKVNFAFILIVEYIYIKKGRNLSFILSKAVIRIKKKFNCVICVLPKTAYITTVVSIDVGPFLYCMIYTSFPSNWKKVDRTLQYFHFTFTLLIIVLCKYAVCWLYF